MKMIVPILSALEGALFAFGVALLVNLSSNWGTLNVLFVELVVMIGAALGFLMGYVFGRGVRQEPWLIVIGQAIAAVIALLITVGLSLVAAQPLHGRLIAVGTVLGSFAGAIVGLGVLLVRRWDATMLQRPVPVAQQPARSVAAPRLPSLEVPAVVDSRPTGGLLAKLGEEIAAGLPAQLRADAQLKTLDDGQACVIIPMRSAAGVSYTLFLICAPGYPEQPPELLLSKIDPASRGEVQLDFRSSAIEGWGRGSRLTDVILEVDGAVLSDLPVGRGS